MNVFIHTLGCRLNQCESESLVTRFANAGYNPVSSGKYADLVVVNTCTVTSKAEQKCRREIRLFSRTSTVIAIGCYARLNAHEIESLAENVYVWPYTDKALSDPLLQRLADIFSSTEGTSQFSSHVRAYLKIQDGCNNECGYCRVRVARGKSVSLPCDEILKTALDIQEKGYKEIVLTGVNLIQYSSADVNLPLLVRHLLDVLSPDIKIRFSSLEPEKCRDEFFDVISDSRIQPYFHLPVQSGSDKVLGRVNRHILTSDVSSMILRLREVKEDPFVSADFITGLPSENEEEFAHTVDFIMKNNFALLHVFPFSPRPDTLLYRARDRAPERVRDIRAEKLRAISAELNTAYKKRQLGKTVSAVIEDKTKDYYNALTANYIKLRIFSGTSDDIRLKPGNMVDVLLTEMDSDGGVYGNLL